MPSIAPSTDFSTIYGNCHLLERAFQKVFSSLTALSLVSFGPAHPLHPQSLSEQGLLVALSFLSCFFLDEYPSYRRTDLLEHSPKHLAPWLYVLVLFVGLNYRFSKGLDPVISKADREFMQNFSLSQSNFLQSQLFIEPILTTIYYLPALVIFA